MKLLDQGVSLTVWGRSPAKLQGIATAGAVIADTPAAVAAASDIVLLCVTDTDAVAEVVFGEHGIATAANAEKLLVDHSTIRASATREMAGRLDEASGMAWLDAPVSGGATGVANKTLAVMCGGEQPVFERAYPTIMRYAGRCTLMGGIGAGQTTKMLNQMLVGVGFALVAEVTALAEAAGVAPERVPEALAGGRADSRLLQEFMPRMAARDFTPSGRIDIMLKDLDMVGELVRASRSAAPMSALAAEIHRLMVARGHGGADNAALIDFFAREHGS